MRLDMDCVRDILLCVEENTGLRTFCTFADYGLSKTSDFLGYDMTTSDFQTALEEKYDNEKLIYHLHYCVDAQLIVKQERNVELYILISDLTPQGHEFLANIRSNNNWTKTKEIGSKVGAFGLNMVSKIAEGVATAYLKQHLGIS